VLLSVKIVLQVEYRLGVVRERVLQPPVTKFLVELESSHDDDHDDDAGTLKSRVWLTRASLRLLQVAYISDISACCDLVVFTVSE